MHTVVRRHALASFVAPPAVFELCCFYYLFGLSCQVKSPLNPDPPGSLSCVKQNGVSLTLANLSRSACLAALSRSLPSASHACLASALDRLTTPPSGSTFFPGSTGAPQNRFWRRRSDVTATVYHYCDGCVFFTRYTSTLNSDIFS